MSGKTVYEDHFSSDMDKGWSWVREKRECWRTGEGKLLVRTLPGTLWGDRNDAANILLRAAPKEITAIEVAVTNHPELGGEQAGLIWYASDGDYIKLVKESLADGVFIVMAREEDDKPSVSGKIPVTSVSANLRLSLTNGRIVGEYSVGSGEDWQRVGECEPIVGDRLMVGLFTHGGPKDTERWVEFESFRILGH
jgi:hypothetical protein